MMTRTGVLLLACLLLTASMAPAADTGRLTFSGIVAGIDPQGRVLLLDEVGPWRSGQGRSVTTRWTVLLADRATFNTFILVNVPGSVAVDFLEVVLSAEDVA